MADMQVAAQVDEDISALNSANAEPADGIDRYLAEYEQATTAPSANAEPPEESGFADDLLAEPEPSPQNIDTLLEEPGTIDAARSASQLALMQEAGKHLEQRNQQLEQALIDQQSREHLRKLNESFDRLAAETQAEFEKQFDDVPPNFVKDFAELAAVRDSRLLNAWVDNGLSWKALPKQLAQQMYKELKDQEGLRRGRQVTEDREAVIFAMKGASTKAPAAEPPPNLGQMSDQEFRDYKRQFGFV